MAARRVSFSVVLLSLIISMFSFAALPGAAHAQAGSSDENTDKPSANRLAQPGELEVTISTPDGGEVYGDLEIYQWQSDGEYFEYYTDVYLENEPSPSVTALSLPAGDYYAQFYSYSRAYHLGFLNGATGPASTPADAGVVSVGPDAGTDASMDLVAMERTDVSGLVTDGSGAPLEGINFYAEQADGETFDYAEGFTGADGAYWFGLLPGTYDLYFYDENDVYEGSSVSIEVADDPLVVPTVALTRVGRWAVSGTVVDSVGQPVTDADVVLYRLYDDDEDGTFDGYDYIDETYSADGNYVFPGTRSNQTYTVLARAPGFMDGVLGGGSDILSGDSFSPEADVVLAPIVLARASTVEGVVSGPAGPASGVEVHLQKWDPVDGSFYTDDYAYTDEDGRYRITVRSTGDYTLFFEAAYASEPLISSWLVGDSAPSGPGEPGTFAVDDTPTDIVRDKALARAPVVNGAVLNEAGDGLADASVVAYVLESDPGGAGRVESYWSQYSETRTRADGTYSVRAPSGETVTLRFARGGYVTQFLGGGNTLPAEADGTNSVLVPETGDAEVAPVTLAPFASQLGKVAGQDFAYCRNNVLPANDDGSSEAVDISFDLKFFGADYDQLWVNNNGTVTFNGPEGQYTPSDLTGETDQPMIAPFFADVDTYGEGSNIVTYGASPDGQRFCVNWADVGYYSGQDDKLNTLQLLLTSNTATAGRVPGDFDITFNYDELLWETGSASGGVDGFGGTSAAVGFTAGSGVPGTFVQFPGSFVNGALLDGGADALIAGSQNSTQIGRYVFQVRNDGVVNTLGDVQGVVRTDTGVPVDGAFVQICRNNGTGCSYTQTNATGDYSFPGLREGGYTIRVWPPNDDLFGGGGSVTVVGGTSTTAAPIVLSAPQPMPSNVTLTNNGIAANGVPSVYYGDPLEFSVTGCAGVVSPTYSVTLASGEVIRDQLPMVESPAGTYRATIAPLVPDTGDARISTNIAGNCGGDLVGFNIYIDPSGIVTDQYGRPIDGATVTLSRSDTVEGSFVDVPDGSDIMSPSNRSNPSITDATGYFRWDVQAGFYRVTAAADGCEPTTTDALEVPPERIDLVIKVSCTGPAPSPATAADISGVPKVGQTLTATDAVWASPIENAGLQLRRNGVALPGTTHTLTPADVGAVFTAVATGQRPDYVTEGGTGATVGFEPMSHTSAAVTGLLGDASTATSPPTIAGSPRVGQTLTADRGVWTADAEGTYEYQWLRADQNIVGATGATYEVVDVDAQKAISVRVTHLRPGYADGSATSASVTIAEGTSAACAQAKADAAKAAGALTSATKALTASKKQLAKAKKKLLKAKQATNNRAKKVSKAKAKVKKAKAKQRKWALAKRAAAAALRDAQSRIAANC